MPITRVKSPDTPLCSPDIVQVTSVASPVGVRVNHTSLVAANGLRKTSLMSTRSGADPVISIEPSPALRLPFQA
jgi:hypothetical protein